MSDKIGLREAVSIGIGGMVGGGIFAVLGLAVSLAGGGTPVAFAIAGILALVTSYSYVKLSLAMPDRGGTVKFVTQGFGKTVFSGGVNNLLWVSYIIMLGLYASAFGSYAPNLWDITGDKTVDFHIYASAIVVLATIINYYSVKVVGRIESVSVFIKVLILIAFSGIGLYGLTNSDNIGQLSLSGWKDPVSLITGGMVIFVAYEGFELIANAVPDLKNPKKNVPRAFYYAVGFVILLYIVIACVTVGSLSFEKIAEASDYVLAEAARPMLGQAGFTVITVAALFSTFSAINASLYGGSRVSYVIAKDDELPHELTYQLWGHPVGLLITAICTLLITNLLELESISTAGSVGFLIIFAVINYTSFKMASDIHASRMLALTGFGLCSLATGVLIYQQFNSNPVGICVALGIVAFCFIIEFIYKRSEKGKSS